MARTHFDDSLPGLVEPLLAYLGKEAAEGGTVLREAGGRLAFFAGTELSDELVARASAHARERVGAYARPDRLIVPPSSPGTERLRSDPAVRIIRIGEVSIRYLDRRVVGSDWQQGPGPVQVHPARVVFASLKGGVGRSTALSVVAAEQARRGRNVLVVDLDLESPGIGSMLLTDSRLPDYGAVDYLVERNVEPLQGADLDALVGTSELTAGAGLVNVVPVVGRRSLRYPENYLAKLSRAMIEEISPDGRPVSLREKIVELLRELEAQRSYDVVLIDSRAGLAELAAGPLLALGASILLFGTAQRQTLEGLKLLFAHFQSLVLPEEGSPWQTLKMVHAKALTRSAHERFKDQLWDLFTEFLYEEQGGIEGFNYGPDDPAAPHAPISIPLDLAFADWDPTAEPSKLVESYYARSYGDLLAFVNDLTPSELP